MPSWLWPAVKLILPHVGNIVAAAKPAFTKLRNGDPQQGSVVEQQIAELQSAASENATHIKELAEQLRLTVAALEKGAAEAEARIKRANRYALAAAVLSLAALAIAFFDLLH
ncbi:MAG: hypothetical protein ACXWCY_08510 [Burkholderiales bacterium]